MAEYIVHKAIELDALSAKAKDKLSTCREWILSPKYDGCHAVLVFEDRKFIKAYSRTGETAVSMNHIGQSIEDNLALPPGRVAICGEAWIPGKEFNEISGDFRRQSGSSLFFVPFDYVDWDYNDDVTSGPPVLLSSSLSYIDRLFELDLRWGSRIHSKLIKPRWQLLIGPLATAIELAEVEAKWLKSRTDSFYDGAVLAPSTGKYTVGAGKGGEFIKIKPLLSYTVTVTGAALDFGTKTGKNTAALKFMLDGIEQKVSTGLTQAQVDEITAVGWDGYRIEVTAMGKTVNGYLREPRFSGLRYDA